MYSNQTESFQLWGCSTGTVAMGIVFLNIVDSEGKSKTLDDYALAYVGVGMVEIVIVNFAPELMMTGQDWLLTLVTVVAGDC
jgi:hypothetical protein